MEKPYYKNCQSCDMPMKRDPLGGGTETDETKSTMYCSHCYRKGSFTRPDSTVEQMQQFCRSKLVEMGFPRFLAELFVKRIPKLERWKND
jgi:hypothetical protein